MSCLEASTIILQAIFIGKMDGDTRLPDSRTAAGCKPAASPAYRAQLRPQAAPIAIKLPTILLFYNGTQSGPFTLFQIQQMFATGEIPPDAFYWQDGMADWRSAEELREPAAWAAPSHSVSSSVATR